MSGKKAGGQARHEGNGLKMMQEPDVIKEHMPSGCERCAEYWVCQEVAKRGEVRYEIDIEIKPKVTGHKRLMIECPRTKKAMAGEFPLGITGTVQYGVNLETLAVSLNTVGMMSIDRTHEILSDVFGVPISTGTIIEMVKNCAEAVKETVSAIKAEIIEAPLAHFDETGSRVDGKTTWAHVASTAGLTYITMQEKRGQEGMDKAGILPNFKGTGIHDCYVSYFGYDEMRHGLCCAHILRELNGVTENYRQEWADEMVDLLIYMKTRKEFLIQQGQYEASKDDLEMCSKCYDEIIVQAKALNPVRENETNKKGRPKRGKVGSLVDRLALRKDQWLLFFTDFSVPFDNNQAERDFRFFKVKQKVSGCFRTSDGAANFSAIMSFISTARKCGLSVFSAIKDVLLGNSFYLSSPATGD